MPCFSVSTVNFEHEIASWVVGLKYLSQNSCILCNENGNTS